MKSLLGTSKYIYMYSTNKYNVTYISGYVVFGDIERATGSRYKATGSRYIF